jgi:putative transposase
LRKHRTMKRKRHTEEQIIAILKEHEAGVKTADLCRKHGISEASFYNWKAKYGGLEVSEAPHPQRHRVRPVTTVTSFHHQPEVQHRDVGRLTLMQSLHSVRLVLWDERHSQLISFREAHRSVQG